VNKRQNPPAYSLPNDQELLNKITKIHKNRCQSCHDSVAVTRADWIDIRSPERSLFLRAPLANEGGGSGKCGTAIYQTTNDPDYRTIRNLVTSAVAKAWQYPRRDLQALRSTEGVVWNLMSKKSPLTKEP